MTTRLINTRATNTLLLEEDEHAGGLEHMVELCQKHVLNLYLRRPSLGGVECAEEEGNYGLTMKFKTKNDGAHEQSCFRGAISK